MKNLTLKIKNYQEDITYVSVLLKSGLTNEQIIASGELMRNAINQMTEYWEGTPNIIRFENEDGIYGSNLQPLTLFYKP
jgi:hypothetical protein